MILSALEKFHPLKVVLFGSRARGNARANSDIDLAIEGNFTFREKRKIKEAANQVSGLYSVDIVFFDTIDTSLQKRIEEEGKVLYEKE